MVSSVDVRLTESSEAALIGSALNELGTIADHSAARAVVIL
jgi:hypothetical protein